ncbi:hypothetical protein PAXRUDRAFT_135014 [Paxillus rubicundulus Ve08.2h10]|uniref:Uncharacterized protein n=1 Tax=Paxillus rubicundulus Ve08.2h10 TaxID=930991 RepID=A0A0D0DUL0_9AGAM|nr:hypothetical protein PAXRUDRAFT_135014 [Paxillus rubicundulus Ve08.2h10]
MGWFSDDSDEANYHDQLTNDKHKGAITHDLLAGAVAYEATKAYEDHLKKNGKPDSHATAKELLAGFVAAAGTQLLETKGLDAYDHYRQSAKQKGKLDSCTTHTWLSQIASLATERLYERVEVDYQ